MQFGDHDTQYTSMSIASLGASTLPDAKLHPKVVYLEKPAEVFATEQSKRVLTNRPKFSDISDIDGAHPKLTKQRNYESKILHVDDIDGAKAKYRDRFFDTKRNVDPLQPEYKLPSYKVEPLAPPKFVKDAMNIDDIEGTRTKQKKFTIQRDTMNVDDIEGARSGWKPRHIQARVDAQPRDVLFTTENLKNKKFQDITTRRTDPNSPQYNIYGMEIADDAKSKPKKLRGYLEGNFLLRTDDVDGARCGQHGAHSLSLPMEKRREFRQTNFLGDIEGAKADTIKHSIQTKRVTNPLQPMYQGLDDGVPLNGPQDPLIPAHMVDTKTSFKVFGSSRDLTPVVSNQSNTAATPTSRRNSSSVTALAFDEADRNFQLGGGSVQATSQYFDESKPYAEKLEGTDLLETKSSYLDVTTDQPLSKPPSHGSLQLDISSSVNYTKTDKVGGGFSSRASSNRSIPPSARSSPQISQRSTGQLSNRSMGPFSNRSGQATPMSSRSPSVSSRRAQAELDAEVNAVRGL